MADDGKAGEKAPQVYATTRHGGQAALRRRNRNAVGPIRRGGPSAVRRLPGSVIGAGSRKPELAHRTRPRS